MSIGYNLPRIHRNILPDDVHLAIQTNQSNPESLENPVIKINRTLSYYLQQAKREIHNCPDWEFYKKFTNPFELINTSIYDEKTVAKYAPISRAYFKMVEIIKHFNLFNNSPSSINTFHLAEGPGGFIEATLNIRNNTNDKYYGMTLIDKTNHTVPSWKKGGTFLKHNPNVHIELGDDKTGNLYSYVNLHAIHTKYKHSMYFITGDGGFDFSTDYQNQEEMAWKLLYAQVIYALSLQMDDGIFVLKCFDIFQENTIDIVYLLSSLYDSVMIYKPQTSRYANSERYIICKGYNALLYTEPVRIKLWNLFVHITKNDINVRRVLNIDIPYAFLSRLMEINAIYGQQQIETIFDTILLRDKPAKIIKYYDRNIQKAVRWCKLFNIPHQNPISLTYMRNSVYGKDLSNNEFIRRRR